MLRALAHSLRGALRQNTDVIRFGGDEFIVILEDTNAADAYAVAERIRLGAHGIDLSGIAPGQSLTVSIGLIEGNQPVRELLMKADLAMYRSKSHGRDQTTVFREDESSDVFHMKV